MRGRRRRSAIEPSQNVWPTTEAACSDAALGPRRASRAAPRAPSAPSPGSASVSAAPSSTIRLTISSANSGLPPERSATWSRELARCRPPLAEQRARPVRWPGSRSSGSSVDRGRVERGRRPSRAGGRAARRGPGRRSAPGRGPARQVLDQVEHPLVGPVDVLDREDQRLAPAARPRPASRTAEKSRSRICCGSSSAALDRARRCARRLDPERPAERRREPLGAAPRPRSRRAASSIPPLSLRQAAPASSVSTMSKVPRTISPSAQ